MLIHLQIDVQYAIESGVSVSKLHSNLSVM